LEAAGTAQSYRGESGKRSGKKIDYILTTGRYKRRAQTSMGDAVSQERDLNV